MEFYKLSSRDIGLLIYLGQRNAHSDEVSLTTSQVANFFSISQQSASRALNRLDSMGLILFNSSPTGSRVRLTELGTETLYQLRFALERAIRPDLSTLRITGISFDGLGEGGYYISQVPYFKAIKSKLGFTPYPGTLNLRVEDSDSEHLRLIRGSWPILLKGFEKDGRMFGDVLCYPVTICSGPDLSAAVVTPRRTHYGTDVVEVISDVYLRDALNLKTGDKLTLEFNLKERRLDDL